MDKYDKLSSENKFRELLLNDSDSAPEFDDECMPDVCNGLNIRDDSECDDTIADDNVSDKKSIVLEIDTMVDSDEE